MPLGVPSRPGPMLGSRAAPFAPRPLPSSRWLQAGEWQVSAYAEVLALLTGGDQMVTVSITNRRVLALNSSGELVGERPLSGVEAEETSARTAQLSEGFAFEFPTPESAREFAKAVVTAGLLMPLPRAGYAGPAQESGN